MFDAETTGLLARRISLIALAGLWIFVTVALVTYDPADPPSHVVAVHNEPVANLCGRFGAALAYRIYEVIGVGAWLLLAGIGAAITGAIIGREIDQPIVRAIGLVLMALAVSGAHALLLPDAGSLTGANAGILATAAMTELTPRFSTFGSLLLLFGAFAIGALVAIDRVVLALPLAVARLGGGVSRGSAPIASLFQNLFLQPAEALTGRRVTSDVEDEEDGEYEYYDDEEEEGEEEDDDGFIYDDDDEEYEDEEEDDGEYDDEEEYDEDEEGEYEEDEDGEYEYEDDEADEEDEEYEDEEEDDEDEEVEATGNRPGLTREQLREKIAKLPVKMASRTTTVARDEDIPRVSYRNYQFPSLELVHDPETGFGEEMERLVRDQAERLEESLHTYNINAGVVGIESGPAVTLYSVQLAPGTKVSKVSAVASDIARSLGTQNIRIVPNMVGKTSIGIEVPNPKREKVRLKELMTGGHADGMVLPMFLGKDASGEPLVADLTRMPHMLIAGTTGSGKSVCMNTILMSWLFTKRPDELKLVLVDPKMVEMSQFQDIPHLMCPVVTESTRAAAIMEWAVERMEERYELLKEARVQNIASYNKLSEDDLYEAFNAESEEEKARIPKQLPYMVFVVDELADMMMTCKEVEHSIVRIAQKARAVGIHLILATQRPQANVVTGLIKANMPCRVSFKVASGMDSRIVLDSKGAELLLGQGDMMFLTPHTSEIRRAQGTLVEDVEIRKVTRFLKEVAAPSFERSLISIRSTQQAEADGGAGLSEKERDPMFDQAVEIMIESGRGSVSLLQRRLSIGYSRASRLVDQMGLAGILGDHKGSVAREVLISIDEWHQMKEMRDEAEREGTLFESDGADDTTPASSTA